jgi:phosphoribosyl 1,2-cyclic phosphodiesterase
MELKVLGSGSSGNCYLLKPEIGKELLIECGLPFKKLKKGLNFKLSNIAGCLLSHEHITDHAKSAKDLIQSGVNVYSGQKTIEVLGINGKIVKHNEKFEIENYTILPFNVIHDAVEPLGFLISHPECGTILFATDTKEIDYKFQNINHWLIEANFSEKMMITNIENDKLNGWLAGRIYDNHMSIEKCIETLKENDLNSTKTITLIHLSSTNAQGYLFQEMVAKKTGHKPNIATEGLTINLD